MKHQLAVAMALATAALPALGVSISIPGSMASPSVQHQSPQYYGCASDGHSMFANAGAGFGRCKMVVPLIARSDEIVGLVRFGYRSADTSHWISIRVYSGSEGVFQQVVEGTGNSPGVQGEAVLDPFVALDPDRYVYAVIEVRGDTKLTNVSYDVLPN